MKRVFLFLFTLIIMGCQDEAPDEKINILSYKDDLRGTASYDSVLDNAEALYKKANRYLYSDSLFDITEYDDHLDKYEESIRTYLRSDAEDSLKVGLLLEIVTKIDVVSKSEALELLSQINTSNIRPELLEKIEGRISLLPKYGVGDIMDVDKIYSYEENDPIDFKLDSDYNVIFFWSTWCGACKFYYPHVNEITRKFDSRDVSVTGFSMDKSKRKFLKHQEEEKFEFKSYADLRKWDSKNAEQFGVQMLPTLYLMDKKGKVVIVNPLEGKGKLTMIVKKLLEQKKGGA